jgi:hypothetical protein
MHSYQVSPALWLVNQPVNKINKPVQVRPPVNHMIVLDCSGSMAGDLPRIREQLKRKVPMILQKEDTLSIIWFSGKGQFGILLEAEPVSTLADLQEVNRAIDRWLQPVGMTGFKEPLLAVAELAKKIQDKRPNSVASLVFMSDGYDNQWDRASILAAAEKAGVGMAATTIVEYGFYADRVLLSQMAELAGGSLVFQQDFDHYAPAFESCLTKLMSSSPKVPVQISNTPVEGVLFSLTGTDLIQYACQNGQVLVPEDLKSLWYLSGAPVGTVMPIQDAIPHSSQDTTDILKAAFGALATLALKAKPDLAYQILKSVGDVRVIQEFGGCFGKQKYSEFRDHCIRLATGQEQPFKDGWDPNAVPDDNCFTLMGLLKVLSEDEDCRLLLDSKDFQYKRIGRAQVDNQDLTDEEASKVQSLQASMQGVKDPKVLAATNREIQAILDEAAKREALKFTPDPQPQGYEVSKLTFAEDRANVSVLVRKEGVCKLPGDRPEGVPEDFKTFIWRNYTIIKDGIVNVEKLPVRLPKGVCKSLVAAGLPESCLLAPEGEDREALLKRFRKAAQDRPLEVVFDLSKLPVLNRAMIQQSKAEHLFRLCWEALKAKAGQKVVGDFKKNLFPQKGSQGLADLYGQAASEWLKEHGLTDGGFSPRTKQAESTDQYMAKELEVKIKGFSSLPSMNELTKKMAAATDKKPLTGGAKLMGASYQEAVKDQPALKTASTAATPEVQAYLDKSLTAYRQEARRLMFEIAQAKFVVIVGQVWFQEFASLEENTLTLNLDGQDILFTAEMREVETKI